MTGQQECGVALAAHVFQEFDRLHRVFRIQSRRRLVREDDTGVPDQCSGDRHSLLLPDAQTINASRGIGDSQSAEQGIRDGSMFAWPDTSEKEGGRDVFTSGEPGEKVMRLKDHPDPIGSDGVSTPAARRRDRSSREENLAGSGIQETGGEEEERALPAPGRAGKEDLFVGGEREFGNSHRKTVWSSEMEVGDLESGFHDRDHSPPE